MIDEWIGSAALSLVVLLPLAALVFGLWISRGTRRNYQRLVSSGPGWRRAPRDGSLWRRSRLLVEFSSRSRGLQEYFHMAGEHRGVPFEAVQYVRPPDAQRRTTTYGVAVLLPRPVPGPELRLAKAGAFSRFLVDETVPLGHREFDRSYLLTGTDPDFCRRAVPPALVQGLLGDQRMRKAIVEFAPGHLIAFRVGMANSRSVLPMLDMLVDIRGGVPWQELAT